MVTFIGIRSPPRNLPAPPWRRRTLCPLLISLSCFFFFFQLLRGRHCLFEITSLLHWHSIGTYLVWTKPPITLVMIIFLWCLMVGMIFVRQIIHVDKVLHFDLFESFDCEIVRLVYIGHGHPENHSSCISSSKGWRRSTPYFLASSRNGVREVALSWCGSEEWKWPIVYLTNFWFSWLPFRKKWPHVQWTMPTSQYNKHKFHFVLGSVSSNSHKSMFPASWIICFNSELKGLNDWLCCRVVLDLLNQFSYAGTLRVFHNRMW